MPDSGYASGGDSGELYLIYFRVSSNNLQQIQYSSMYIRDHDGFGFSAQ